MKNCTGVFTNLTLLCALAGCAEDNLNRPNLDIVPVSGVVTFDGEPLANAAIQFLPKEGGSIHGTYHGTTDAEGSFVLVDRGGSSGAEPGTYTVVISRFAQQDGSPLPADADSGDLAALGMEHLPPQYSDPKSSELRATIPTSGKTELEFALTSR